MTIHSFSEDRIAESALGPERQGVDRSASAARSGSVIMILLVAVVLIASAAGFVVLGRSNAERVEHALFDSPLWDDCPEIEPLKTMARDLLGTVGSGNHYVDLFADGDGFVWIGVHFGSRGLGHKTATAFLKLAGGKDGIDVDPALLHQDSELGQKYLAGMTLAGEYAYAGRTST